MQRYGRAVLLLAALFMALLIGVQLFRQAAQAVGHVLA